MEVRRRARSCVPADLNPTIPQIEMLQIRGSIRDLFAVCCSALRTYADITNGLRFSTSATAPAAGHIESV